MKKSFCAITVAAVLTGTAQTANADNFAVNSGSFFTIQKLDPATQARKEQEWFTNKKITLAVKTPTPVSKLVPLLREQGLVILSSEPLGQYTYKGNGVSGADAATALHELFGTAGLVYAVNYQNRTITLKKAPAPIPVWIARTGSTLKGTLIDWASRAGYHVVWGADYDYPIDAQLAYQGSFFDALKGIFTTFESADKPLLADVKTNNVIYVTPR